MRKILYIALFSIKDQIRHKSFYILLAVCILFVMLLRSCYQGGSFIANGQQVDSATIAWHASKLAFHLIAGGMMLLTALLSMSIFTRDIQNGGMVLALSKPIKRSHYVLGRLAGVWILLSIFMMILHLTIVIIGFVNTGDIVPEFLLSSAICSLNLLFILLLVSLLSLFLPDFISALAAMGVAAISFVSDSFFMAQQSNAFPNIFSSGADSQVSIWRILWPKTALLQYYASSFIGHTDFTVMGPVHPLVNILIYILIIYFVLIWIFNRREV